MMDKVYLKSPAFTIETETEDKKEMLCNIIVRNCIYKIYSIL